MAGPFIDPATHVGTGPGIGVVVIGRNEGERLMRCLASVSGLADVVYVDSGSTDGSVARARALGVEVVELAVPPAFTAARARNTGIATLQAGGRDLAFVQTIDGDCELVPDWLAAAAGAMADPANGIVIGRLRERHPERSIYNALCDHEWDGVPGEAPGCGGIALIRLEALEAAGGYRADMIAGEDTEMAMRVRKAGWRVQRIAAEMAWHDAAITRFGQWWRRQGRGGHGFAEMAWLHPDARWPDWPRTVRSILAWGLAMPLLLALSLLLAAVLSVWWLLLGLLVLLPWPLQMARLARAGRRAGLSPRVARASGVLTMIGKLSEARGLLRFHIGRLTGRGSRIIEYKGTGAPHRRGNVA